MLAYDIHFNYAHGSPAEVERDWEGGKKSNSHFNMHEHVHIIVVYSTATTIHNHCTPLRAKYVLPRALLSEVHIYLV